MARLKKIINLLFFLLISNIGFSQCPNNLNSGNNNNNPITLFIYNNNNEIIGTIICNQAGGNMNCNLTNLPNDAEYLSFGDINIPNDLGSCIYNTDGTISNNYLPIELIDFIGYSTNGINRLEWSVASEIDNDYYVIEKSLDGLKWSVIDKIDGYGTTTSQQNYYTFDNNTESELNYYKLSQVDFNGSKTELKIIAIDNKNKILQVIKITNIIGQEVNNEYVGVKLFHMSNGEIIKKY